MTQEKHNNVLMQQLISHFNLQFDPFSNSSLFFFEGAQRQHNLETLRHLATFGDMVLLLTGDKGAGKTCLLRKLESTEDESLNVIYLDCEQLLHQRHGQPYISLKACLDALDLGNKASEPLEILNSLLIECHRVFSVNGVRTLFSFDNADKLPKKELQLYFDFCKKLPNESAFVMLFAGSSSLIQASKSGAGSEQDSWCHQIQLKPFLQSEVLPYLTQALESAGSTKKLDLTDVQTQQLLELGKGLPGRINKLFPSVVLEPGLLKIKPKSDKRGAPVSILFGLAGLLVLSFLFVSYQHGLFDKLMPVFSFEETVLANQSSAYSDIEEKNKQQQARLAMLDEALKSKGLEVVSSQVPNNSEVLENDAANPIERLASDSGKLEDINEEVIPPIKAQQEILSSEMEDLELPSENLIDEKVDLPEKNEHETQKAGKSSLEEQKHLKALYDLGFREKQWLLKQPESSYLAQILGSYQEETAQNFIKKIGKQKFDVYYLKTEHKGKPWFVVFYGLFPAKTHAQDAVKNAPKIIRSQSPWIRRASEVLASYPKN